VTERPRPNANTIFFAQNPPYISFSSYINYNYSQNIVELIVRSLDPDKQFNLKDQKCFNDYCKFIYMDYYFNIIYLLQNENIPFNVSI
jgi:hypothetical protein